MSPIGQKKNSFSGETGSPPSPMRRLSRSQSITTSTIPPNVALPPEIAVQWRRRRESLEKLQLDKVAPWMHLHDFSDEGGQTEEQLRKRRASLEKLQLEKVAPWMHIHDFSESEPQTPKSESANSS